MFEDQKLEYKGILPQEKQNWLLNQQLGDYSIR